MPKAEGIRSYHRYDPNTIRNSTYVLAAVGRFHASLYASYASHRVYLRLTLPQKSGPDICSHYRIASNHFVVVCDSIIADRCESVKSRLWPVAGSLPAM